MGEKHIPNVCRSKKASVPSQTFERSRVQGPLLRQAERAAVQTVTGRRGSDAEQPGFDADSRTYCNFTIGTPPLKNPLPYL